MARTFVPGLIYLTLASFINLPADASGAERFFCRAEQAVGFTPESWKTVTPDITDKFYLISPMEVLDGKYAVVRLGDKNPLYYCESGGAGEPNILSCGMNKLEFVINISSGRYQRLNNQLG